MKNFINNEEFIELKEELIYIVRQSQGGAEDIARINELIRLGINIAECSAMIEGYPTSLLTIALNRKHLNVADVLIQGGADVNEKNQRGCTPLHDSVIKGDIAATTLLLRHGARVNEKNSHDSTPLHHAVWIEHIEIAQLLIAYGADVNAEDRDTRTPLTLTYQCELARILIQHGAVLNEQQIRKLHIFKARTKCITLLPLAVILRNDALIDEILTNSNPGVIPDDIQAALKANDFSSDAAKEFIAKDDRMIALHIATAMGQNDLIRKLLAIPHVEKLAQLDTDYHAGVPETLFDFSPRVAIHYEQPVEANPPITLMRNKKRPIRGSEYNLLIEEGERFVGTQPLAKRRKLG